MNRATCKECHCWLDPEFYDLEDHEKSFGFLCERCEARQDEIICGWCGDYIKPQDREKFRSPLFENDRYCSEQCAREAR